MNHRVLIHAVFETTISQDDPAYAKSVVERLFEDEITSKAEMFSVRVGRVEVEPNETGLEHSPLPWEVFPEKIIVAEPERARVVIRAANGYRVAVENNPERWEQALKDFEFVCRAVRSQWRDAVSYCRAHFIERGRFPFEIEEWPEVIGE